MHSWLDPNTARQVSAAASPMPEISGPFAQLTVNKRSLCHQLPPFTATGWLTDPKADLLQLAAPQPCAKCVPSA